MKDMMTGCVHLKAKHTGLDFHVIAAMVERKEKLQ